MYLASEKLKCNLIDLWWHTFAPPPWHARKIISICIVNMLTCNISIISTYDINYVYNMLLKLCCTSTEVNILHVDINYLACIRGRFVFRYGMRFSLKENLITPVGCGILIPKGFCYQATVLCGCNGIHFRALPESPERLRLVWLYIFVYVVACC